MAGCSRKILRRNAIMNAIKNNLGFLRDIFKNRQMLWTLSKNDFKARFASSYLGAVWAFIQPLATMLVFWYVFQVGLRNAPINGIPFIVWFAPAYLVWTFFSDTVTMTTVCMSEYSYLVKKVNFRVGTVPIMKLISGSLVHIAFIAFIFILNICYGYGVSIYNIQVIYYFLCTVVLLLGLGWLLSSISPFVRDVPSIVSVVLQIIFWSTPIVWSPQIMNESVQRVLQLNPLFYISQGYRDTFVEHVWFWERGVTGIYFWGFTLIVLLLGAYTFKKLRPQFADVL